MDAFAPIDTLIPLFLDAGSASNDFLGEVAHGFFQITVWAAIFWGVIRVMAGADSLEGSSVQLVGWFLRIFVLSTVAAFLLPTIIPALIEGALGIGTGISGGTMTAADFMAPSRLAVTGWTEVEKLLKHAMSRCNGIQSCFTNTPTLIYYILASLVVLASFVAMIIMIILSYVYFIMEGIGTLVMIGFLGADKLAWMGRGGQATLVSRFVTLIIMSASLSVGSVIFEAVRLSGEPSLAQAVVAAVVALIIAILVFKSEQIGASVVGGMAGTQTGGTASGLMGATAGLLGAAGMAAGSMVRGSPGGSGSPGGNVPPTPSSRGGGDGGGGGSGAGHGSNPFGPSTSTASQSGAGKAGSSGSSHTDWRGQGAGGLGNDIGGMGSERAAATISDRAKQLSAGHGNDAEAPTAQQWGDAKLLGTNITGMSQGQARAALDAHQGWYESRSGVAPTSSSSTSADVGAPVDWMPQTGHSAAAGSTSPPSTGRPPSGHSNDGRFMIPENRVHAIGIGGGFGGTGYHGQDWQGVSVKSKGVSALTGQSAARRAEEAPMRAVHFGHKAQTAA